MPIIEKSDLVGPGEEGAHDPLFCSKKKMSKCAEIHPFLGRLLPSNIFTLSFCKLNLFGNQRVSRSRIICRSSLSAVGQLFKTSILVNNTEGSLLY